MITKTKTKVSSKLKKLEKKVQKAEAKKTGKRELKIVPLSKNFSWLPELTGALAVSDGKNTFVITEQLVPEYKGRGVYCRGVYQNGKQLGVSANNTADAVRLWFSKNQPLYSLDKRIKKDVERSHFTVNPNEEAKNRCKIIKMKGNVLKFTDINAFDRGILRTVYWGKTDKFEESDYDRIEKVLVSLLEQDEKLSEWFDGLPEYFTEWSWEKEMLFLYPQLQTKAQNVGALPKDYYGKDNKTPEVVKNSKTEKPKKVLRKQEPANPKPVEKKDAKPKAKPVKKKDKKAKPTKVKTAKKKA